LIAKKTYYIVRILKLGDSGGPLYEINRISKHVVAGVVSYGANGCGSAGIPQG
jgi:secreted trypsin-like serine protease